MTGTTPNFRMNCGASLPEGAKFCPSCGTAVQPIAAVGQNPDDESARTELKLVRGYAGNTRLRAALAAIDRTAAHGQS